MAVGTEAAPAPITEIAITASPTGEVVMLDWSAYNQWAELDIDFFEIYYTASGPFDDINQAGLQKVVAPGESTSATIENLPAWTDHFFAIVAVDVLGNVDPSVTYAASYVLSPDVVSREVSLFIENGPAEPYGEVISRELSLAVASPAPPTPITDLALTVSPTGDVVTLDWSAYNQWVELDIAHFDLYYTDSGPFTDVSEPGLTKVTLPAEPTSATVENLTPWTDHYFALVPVDALGNFQSAVTYSAAYVLAPEVISRELSLFIENGPAEPYAEVISREYDLLVPDAEVPDPVTGIDSGFFVETSTTAFGAVDLDWTSYNQHEQLDVIEYRVYFAESFFDTITADMSPIAVVPGGIQRHTLPGLPGGGIYHFAVVAADSLGNANPTVRSFSAKTSVSAVGEVVDFAAISGANSLSFTWMAPPDTEAFRAAYHVYFDDATSPVVLPASATSWEATGLESGRGYLIRLATVDGFGNESDGITLLAPTWLPNPDNVGLTVQGNEVQLFWQGVQPGGLVRYYEVYESASPITSIAGLTPLKVALGTTSVLGEFAAVSGKHYAVATVNTLDESDPAVTSVQATKQSQTIDFPDIVTGPREILLQAVASSGLPVRYEVSPRQAAAVEGSTLIVHQGGPITLTAFQDGDAQFWPTSTSQSLHVPPVFASFALDGTLLEDGRVLTSGGTLSAEIRDAVGVAQVNFYGRASGSETWQSLGLDQGGVDEFFSVPWAFDSVVDGPYQLRAVGMTASDFSVERVVSVVIDAELILGMTLDATLEEGQTLSGQVAINRTRSTDYSVTISSSRPGQIDPGPPALIPAGQTSALFTLTGLQDTQIEAPSDIRIEATGMNARAASAVVMLLDDDWPGLLLSVDREVISEGDGSQAAMATLERVEVSPEAVTVWLTNTDPSAVMLPEQVTFPAGQATVQFPIAAVDDTVPDGTQSATIRAELRLDGYGTVVESNAITLEVGDDEGPRLELIYEADWLLEGGQAEAILRRLDSSTAALTVSLSVDASGHLDLPGTVEIPANQTEVAVPFAAVSTVETEGHRFVKITAAAAGHSPGQATVLVTDLSLPDLVTKDVRASSEVATEEEFLVRYAIENRGLMAASDFLQRIWLSEDSVLGDDVLLSQYAFAGELDPGVSFSRSETVRSPRVTGMYWILVTTDAVDAVEEMLESNNATLISEPLVVTAAYGATVSTEVETIPANTPIPLTGSAWKDGAKVPHSMVNIHIRRGETERVIAALTNSVGDFAVNWQPLPGEGGFYEIGAVHPGIGEAPTQDQFTILTVDTDFPEEVIAFEESASASITGTLTNPTAMALTGLTLMGHELPEGLSAAITLPNSTLAAGSSLTVGVVLTAAAGFSGEHRVHLRLDNDQGVILDIPVEIEVAPLIPVLAVTPNPLRCSVVRGGQKTVNIQLENTGGLETGPIEVLIPEIPWMQLASPGTLPSILPGEASSLNLLLTPSATEALTLFEGHLVLSPANGDYQNLPFAFRVVSDLMGDLEVEVVDEYFYFTEEAPKVEGATVTLRDAITSEELARQTTSASGEVSFPNIQEGWYRIDVDSPTHTRSTGNYFIDAGETNREQIFITRELVTYNWTVEEVELEDRYRISVETTFETNVPAPVVTVTPATLELGDLTTLGQTKVINYTFENHGFIAAEQGKLSFAEHPFYEITPLIEDVGTIPAKSSITVPVTVRKVGEFADDGSVVTLGQNLVAANGLRVATQRSRVPCSVALTLSWFYVCGDIPVPKFTPIPGSWVEGDCEGNTPKGDPGPGATFSPVAFQSAPGGCLNDCVLEIMFEFTLKLIPLPAWFGCARALATASNSLELDDAGSAAISCACAVLESTPVAKPAGAACDIAGYVDCFEKLVECARQVSAENQLALVVGGIRVSQSVLSIEAYSRLAKLDQSLADAFRRAATVVDFFAYVYGGVDAYQLFESKDAKELALLFAEFTDANSADGRLLNAGELHELQEIADRDGLDRSLVEMVLVRWNLTVEMERQGIVEPEDETPGIGDSFIALSELKRRAAAMSDAFETSVEEGFENPFDEMRFYAGKVSNALSSDSSGVCAKVKINIDQDAVMTRSAFNATLDLGNNLELNSLTQVGFDLDIRDAAGESALDHFNVQKSELSGLAAIDGTGVIAPQSNGTARWSIIPRDTAAPLADTLYTIGGTISYLQEGTLFSIPVEPVAITVRPDAALYLKYFHQRDVFSDDPHTDRIEPAIPYSLAVLIENQGAGAARDLTITSAQPEIVENEKGLFIDFQIIGTEVAGQNLSPSLTATFGTIPAGGSSIGTWLMTSTLQGLFIDYEATFEHLDGFGDPRLSLIKQVEIHEMNHMIQALGSKDDGLPDFLVNDVADIDDYPDTVHFSDGGTAAVTVLESASIAGTVSAGNLSVVMTAAMGADWTYLRVPEPTDGGFRLVSVERSDGLEIPIDRNVWVTDRTFIGLGRRPIYENVLHLVDCESTGEYTLHYEARPDADILPPLSMVTALAAESGASIPVMWEGEDEGGVAFYDVFVSEDGGAFMPWLTETRGASGIFEGEPGKTYAFYSVATDYAGNREAVPPQVDTQTSVTFVHQAPELETIPNQEVDEGEVLVYQVMAEDPEGGPVTYTIDSEASGLVIDPASGLMRWVTGETDGGRAFEAVVVARDAGIPAKFAQQAFQVTVRDTNAPPIVSPIPGQTVGVDEILLVDVDGVDTDAPPQTLLYSLGIGAPSGMTIDSESGLLSWTPTLADAGQRYEIVVTVTDNGVPAATTTLRFPVAVVERADRPPLFEGEVPVVLWLEGKSYTLAVRASDPDGDVVSLSAELGALLGKLEFTESADGQGEFHWPGVNAAPGVYEVPVRATANGLTTTESLMVRVAEDNQYWNWALANLAGKATLSEVELAADPDGDGTSNVNEMVFLTDPAVADAMDLDGESTLSVPFTNTELRFQRRQGSQDYVRIFPEASPDLKQGNWLEVNASQWDASIIETDSAAGTETIRIRIFEHDPEGMLERMFYRVGTERREQP